MIRESFWLIVTTEEWDMRQTNGTRKSHGEKIVKDIWTMLFINLVQCEQHISDALESAGVEFIAENGGGAGVRLRLRK